MKIIEGIQLLAFAALIAPSAGFGDSPQRTKDWLPAADTLVLPVQGSVSPDGRYSIGWGYETGPVDWKKLAHIEEGTDWGAVTFSTKLATGPLDEALENDGNFLLDHRTGKPLCKLGLYYPGERQRFNHDELIAQWSPSSACVAVIVTQKWETEFAHLAWISGGKSAGSHDILKPLIVVAREALMKSRHPAAERLRGEDDYGYTLSDIQLKDDGSFAATLSGEVPKLDALEAFFQVQIEGLFAPGAAGESASLKLGGANVLLPQE